MKKTFTILLSIAFFYAYSENWEDHWIKALKEPSEKELNLAIKLLEETSNENHPYVYLDRGNFYLNQSKYEEAITDFTKALASPHLTEKDKTRSLVGRMSAYYFSGAEAKAKADHETFKRHYQDFAKLEVLEDKIIIRNAPEDETFKKIISKALITTQLCKNESNIEIINGDTWIIKK